MSEGRGKGGGSADLSAWLAVAAGTIGSFMATLDTSIVNAALPTIQGEIGASEDEGTWISTAYLVAEIIMIPIAGWLDKLLGLRRFLLICTVAFVAFSILCGLSHSLVVMVIGRIGQGFSGGAMVPTALTIVATRLPPDKRPVGTALFGMTAVMGPVLGPLVGGWLTENYSWHLAFFINVPIGALLVALLFTGLEDTKAKLSEFKNIDVLGILGLILFLGALTTVLEEGQRERWFESEFITRLAVVSATGFVIMILGQVVSKHPVIQLRIILQRGFGSVFVLSLVVGAALYGVNYILPQFLSTLADYNALQSGLSTMVSGFPPLLMMATFPLLVKRLDVRAAVILGLLLYAAGCLINAHLTTDTDGFTFFNSQLLVGFGQFFAFVFLNQAATSAVSEELAEDASGLFNAARNLGGSFGFCLIKTLREGRTWFHHERIAENLHGNGEAGQAVLAASAAQAGMGDMQRGLRLAYAQLDRQFEQAGTALAYSDVFFVFGVMLLLAVPLCFLMKPLPKGQEASMA